MKNKYKKKGVIVWGSVSAVIIALVIAINVVTTGWLYSLINLVLPGSIRPVFADGVESYYTTNYTSKEEVYKAAQEFNQTLAGEGITLLKNNNNALPIATPKTTGTNKASVAPKISVFGKNSVNLAYGGSGSSSSDSSTSDDSGSDNTTSTKSTKVDLYTALANAGYDYNPTLKKFYDDTKASGSARAISGKDLDKGDTVVLSTAETPQSSYTAQVKESYKEYNEAAIVVFTRVGGEGMDLPRTMSGANGYRNEDDHFLQLDKNEEDLLAAVCNAGFQKVIVVINASNAMELGFLKEGNPYVTQKGYSIDPSKIDAALWMGYPGDTGTNALASILNGNVNPSGHLPDTYVTDLKQDPTWNNFGDNLRTSIKNDKTDQNGGDQYTLNGTQKYYYFVDYEEGVYVGYRYYETRGLNNEKWYNDSVVYPFGYGLSYTQFSWSVQDDSSINNVAIDKNGKYTIKVAVTNTGSVAGKDVVQLYGHAPYKAGEIEKSEEILLDFAKTETIEPGKTAYVELTFDPYYLASYDYKDANHNNFCGYELEQGSYALYISSDAHTKLATIPFRVESDIRYDKSTVNEDVTVENLYTDQEDEAYNSDTQLSTVLSRNDWEGTWPTTPDESDWEQPASFFAQLDDRSTNNPNDLSDVDMPDSDIDNNMTLRDLLFDDEGNILDEDGDGIPFVEYDDERWDALLDQANISQLINMYDTAAYTIAKVESIGLPVVNCGDGPVGWTCLMNQKAYRQCCNYTAEAIAAATWNQDLLYEFGQMIGDEGIIGDVFYSSLPYSGIYAPGINIHRSAFGGRNAEYYSEDPVLSGKLAAQQIKGMQSKGTFGFAKHFALNEQETHRSISGDCSWVTEQAMREIYLRGFEIAVKDGGARGVMSSFNRIGTRWTGGDYRLLTTILRDEWGFKGTVICDFNTIPTYMNSRQMAYAGGDLNLTTSATSVSWCDDTSAEDVYILRQNAKNVLYTVVNSNAMNTQVVGYKMPIWEICMIIADVVIGIALAVWGFFAIRKMLKHPLEEADKN
jgi:beta-glucosidase